jgi:ABC-type multidrug transport system ATPase subunit
VKHSPSVRISVESFLRSIKSSEEQSDTISRLIERFDERHSDWSETLSGGEKKIVQLCNFFIKASHEKTSAIFLDESLNGMDPNLTVNVMKQVKGHFGDKIVLVVTHQHQMQNDLYKQEEDHNFFDKMLKLEDGHLLVSDYC